MKIYDISVNKITGEKIKMGEYKNKILLIVNVASKCGLKKQIIRLIELQNKYQNKNFKVLAFPSDNFLNQEPGCNIDIKKKYDSEYNINYDLFEKVNVKKSIIHPLYKFLLENTKKNNKIKNIRWNFEKFLVNRHGDIIKRFSPLTNFSKMEKEINKLI